MKRLLLSIAILLCLSSCSIEVAATSPAATAPANTAVPSATAPGPVRQGASSPVPQVPGATSGSGEGFVVPVTWGDLGLTGRIVITAGTQGVDQLDLATGEVIGLFKPPDPEMSWVIGQSVSPDGGLMVMAYAPPPPSGKTQTGYTDLVIVPMDGSSDPQPLVERSDPDEDFIWPAWTPDGEYVYFVHITPPEQNSYLSHFVIERLKFPDGQLEMIADNAIWPRLSSDGSKLTYVMFDPVSAAQSLYVAEPDGSDARHIELPGSLISIDSPMFTPNGDWIMFSGITQGLSLAPPPSLLDRLLYAQPASANGAPADWFRVPVSGGPPEKLTNILDLGMYGTFSPDGGHVAYSSYTGLFVMNPDGTNIIELLGIESIPGAIGQATVNWLP